MSMSIRTAPPPPGGGTRSADRSRYREARDAWSRIPGRRTVANGARQAPAS